MSDDENRDSQPKGGLGMLFVAAALGLAVLLTVIGLLAYAAMR